MGTAHHKARAKRRFHGGQCPPYKAFTLLEVILSLAILTGAMATLGELGRLGFQNAKNTREMATAQTLCESKLAEITAGILEPESITGTCQNPDGSPFTTDGVVTWSYSIEVVMADLDEGLLAVHVYVVQDNVPEPVDFMLVRWIPDPNFELSGEEAAADM